MSTSFLSGLVYLTKIPLKWWSCSCSRDNLIKIYVNLFSQNDQNDFYGGQTQDHFYQFSLPKTRSYINFMNHIAKMPKRKIKHKHNWFDSSYRYTSLAYVRLTKYQNVIARTSHASGTKNTVNPIRNAGIFFILLFFEKKMFNH